MKKAELHKVTKVYGGALIWHLTTTLLIKLDKYPEYIWSTQSDAHGGLSSKFKNINQKMPRELIFILFWLSEAYKTNLSEKHHIPPSLS